MLWLKAVAWKQLGRKSLFGGRSLYVTSHAYLLPVRSIQKTGKICILRSPWPGGGLAAVPLSVNICVSHTACQSTRPRNMLPALGRLASSHCCLKLLLPLADLFWEVFQRWMLYVFCSLIYIWFILFAVLLYLGHSLPTLLPFFFPPHYPW